MWKKDEGPAEATQPPGPAAAPRVESPARPRPAGAERATIGRSITIRGDVTGEEDLVIQGTVEGTVDLKQFNVTVGPEGKVTADVTGRGVTVEGEVKGNLHAQEHVVLRSTARVQGDLVAPKVVIEEGAVFRGNIDMSPKGEGARRSAAGPTSLVTPAGAATAAAEGEARGTAKA